MDGGFDFSQIKWLLIVGVAIIFNFLNKKPKVDPNFEKEEEAENGEKGLDREALDKLLAQQSSRVGKSDVKYNYVTPGKSTVEDAPIGEESSNDEHCEEEEFDLRKAVIMSEILKRKYDE